MIIFKDPPLAIITPPKNASTSLHTLLCSPEIGGIHTIGPMPGPEPVAIERHTMVIHRDWVKECRPVIVVRDPYERAVSLWQHGIRYGKYGKNYSGNLVGFIRGQLIRNAWHWWHWPSVKYLANCNSDLSPVAIRVGKLESDLGNLGIKLGNRCVPLENISSAPSKTVTLGKTSTELVNLWAFPDFEAFEFKKIGETSEETIPQKKKEFQKWRPHHAG